MLAMDVQGPEFSFCEHGPIGGFLANIGTCTPCVDDAFVPSAVVDLGATLELIGLRTRERHRSHRRRHLPAVVVAFSSGTITTPTVTLTELGESLVDVPFSFTAVMNGYLENPVTRPSGRAAPLHSGTHRQRQGIGELHRPHRREQPGRTLLSLGSAHAVRLRAAAAGAGARDAVPRGWRNRRARGQAITGVADAEKGRTAGTRRLAHRVNIGRIRGSLRLITQRSRVQIPPPQPINGPETRFHGPFSCVRLLLKTRPATVRHKRLVQRLAQNALPEWARRVAGIGGVGQHLRSFSPMCVKRKRTSRLWQRCRSIELRQTRRPLTSSSGRSRRCSARVWACKPPFTEGELLTLHSKPNPGRWSCTQR